jgi:hypothetical protein
MPREIKVAAVQMTASLAPIASRLPRAQELVEKAARLGAQLVVLPELFNTGYTYSRVNHERAETMDGKTAAWMKTTAARLGVHLAGTLLLRDQDEIYNTMLLYAPDGRMWRYDKNFPWAWERGYFRESDRITVAQTDLGDLGMMICWDAAHPSLWRRYAGRVDMMLVSSSPIDISEASFHFLNGERVTLENLGLVRSFVEGTARCVFTKTIPKQAAWLGVPALNTSGAGFVTTWLPKGRATLLAFAVGSPRLLRLIKLADHLVMTAPMLEHTGIYEASGKLLSKVEGKASQGIAVADVNLPEKRPQPAGRQPVINVSLVAYYLSDVLLRRLSIPVYRQGLRQAWGKGMAPVSVGTRRWRVAAGALAVFGVVVGVILGRSMGRKN